MVRLFPTDKSLTLQKSANLRDSRDELFLTLLEFLFVLIYFGNIGNPLFDHFLDIHPQQAEQNIGSFSSEGSNVSIPAILCTQLGTPEECFQRVFDAFINKTA
jgi:hypothetical protein